MKIRVRSVLYVTFLFVLMRPAGLFADEKSAVKAPVVEEKAAPPSNNPQATASDSTKPKEGSEREPAMAKAPPKPLALSIEGLKELESRERLISEKEKEISERERAVGVQEKVLQNKLKRIEEVSAKMAARLDKFKDDSEGKVTKLVTMLENMKPDAAAGYLENLDPYLAVEVIARINIQKAAKIWNKMDKRISARLSELYTGFRSKLDKDESGAPAPASTTKQPASQGKS